MGRRGKKRRKISKWYPDWNVRTADRENLSIGCMTADGMVLVVVNTQKVEKQQYVIAFIKHCIIICLFVFFKLYYFLKIIGKYLRIKY